jgi:hypothetical protein
LLERRGQHRAEEFARLELVTPVDLAATKAMWRSAPDDAERFVDRQDPDQAGCLYWSRASGSFVMPTTADLASVDIAPHFGRPGGVLPAFRDAEATG